MARLRQGRVWRLGLAAVLGLAVLVCATNGGAGEPGEGLPLGARTRFKCPARFMTRPASGGSGLAAMTPDNVVFLVDATEGMDEATETVGDAICRAARSSPPDSTFGLMILGGQVEVVAAGLAGADAFCAAHVEDGSLEAHREAHTQDPRDDYNDDNLPIVEALRIALEPRWHHLISNPSGADLEALVPAASKGGDHRRTHFVVFSDKPSGVAFHAELRVGDQTPGDDLPDPFDADPAWTEELDAVVGQLVAASASLTLVVGTADFFGTSSVEQLGDPALDVAYSDKTHFRGGLTLRALGEADFGSSLQAKGLRTGVWIRLFSIDDLEENPSLGNLLTLVEDRLGAKRHPPATNADQPVPLIRKSETDEESYTKENVVKGLVKVADWDPEREFTSLLAGRGVPMILQNAAPELWRARRAWTPLFLEKNIGIDRMAGVKTTHNMTVFDADPDRPFSTLPTLSMSTEYTTRDMDVDEFFQRMRQPEPGVAYYYFGDLTDDLYNDVQPNANLFLKEIDAGRRMQYLWLSSRGPKMHTHFDQDHNFFVQIHGRKRFTLFNPEQDEEMYCYPRNHPLWHKSQADFESPDLDRFPNYAKAKAYVADLGPGDVLYVPPYWWHYVESLSTSISISTWSRFEVVNNNMNPAYERTLYIQRLATNDDRRLGLQLYFSMLVDYVYGPCRARVVVDRLLRQRYDALAPVFDVESGRSSGVCGDQGVVLDGTSADVGAAEAFGLGASVEAGIHKDARFVADHFARIPLPAMDILFLDYLEEIASEVVSASEMAAFFRDCF